MNNTIKLILAFAGGLVAGGAAMWYYNRKKIDEYREVLETENECLKGYVDELEKELDIGKKKEEEEMTKFHKEIQENQHRLCGTIYSIIFSLRISRII